MISSNVLLSFPRSGNTWVRYIFEFITKRPTSQGLRSDCLNGVFKEDCLSSDLNLGADPNAECILVKRHRADFPWDKWTTDNCKLLLLVRDYKEAIIRHSYNKDDQTIENHIDNYLHCLEFYDQFEGEKLLIYYEDLILLPQKEIDKMITFLNVPKNEHYKSFFKNYEKHKDASVAGYGISVTKGNPRYLKLHANSAGVAITNQICKPIKASPLYKKYLKRYG